MKIQRVNEPLIISDKLAHFLETEIEKLGVDTTKGVLLCFTDPDYEIEENENHPMEIIVSKEGLVLHIIERVIVKKGGFEKLDYTINFDIKNETYFQWGHECSRETANILLEDIVVDLLIHRYNTGIYQASVRPLK